MSPLYGAVEAGGTKFNCAVGTGPADLRAQIRIDTDNPESTLEKTCTFFRAAIAQQRRRQPEAASASMQQNTEG